MPKLVTSAVMTAAIHPSMLALGMQRSNLQDMQTSSTSIVRIFKIRSYLQIWPKWGQFFMQAPHCVPPGRQIYAHTTSVMSARQNTGPCKNFTVPGHQHLTHFEHRASKIASFVKCHVYRVHLSESVQHVEDCVQRSYIDRNYVQHLKMSGVDLQILEIFKFKHG